MGLHFLNLNTMSTPEASFNSGSELWSVCGRSSLVLQSAQCVDGRLVCSRQL